MGGGRRRGALPRPNGSGKRGEEPLPRVGRQLHELRRDEVEGVEFGSLGVAEKVDVPPFDTRCCRRIGLAGSWAARPRATPEMSVATTRQPRWANQMASAPL